MKSAVRLFLLFNLLACSFCHANEKQQALAEMRKTFLQAEQYIDQDRDVDYFALADTIKSYPLYPYLHYQWLKKHLDFENAVLSFLQEYPQSRYAQSLRHKWLIQLGEKQQWQTFLNQYRNTDDQELLCYKATGQFQTGVQPAIALESARQFWVSGKSQPPACDGLFTIFKASPAFNEDTIWQRFMAAILADNTQIASQMLAMLSNHAHEDALLWLDIHNQPWQVADPGDWKRTNTQAGKLFAHAILRWLENDTSSALQTWDAQKQNYIIPEETYADTEKRLAMTLAFKRDPRAYDRLSQIGNPDSSSREWRIRAGLYWQNWQQVITALQALNDEEKRQDKWQYWHARALSALGDTQLANGIYQQVAKNRSFYGFLAANKIQQNISLVDQPLSISEAETQALEQQNEFQVFAELLAIGRKAEAKKQWWYATGTLDPHGLIIAAKLAQKWRQPSLSIFTVAKANEWDDLALRFPLLYQSQIDSTIKTHTLDPAVVYGLIRQESAFDDAAESPVGAKGLMQLMPKTAQQISQELKEKWTGEYALFNPEVNIKYGGYYYKKLLQQFKGTYLLATAAYNAGPAKIKRWLPDNNALPGDIWLESIPYKETRGYVSSVLFYTLIYQQRLQRTTLKTADLMPEILTEY